MKQHKKKERLEARIKDWEKTMQSSTIDSKRLKGYNKPGSMNK